MNTNENESVLFHTRMQNILDGNESDKYKSETIIKLMSRITTDISNMQFQDQNSWEEFIGENLGQEMRVVVRKISHNANLIHDDQLFQLISILTTLHTSAIANMIISYDMFSQMNKQKEKAISDMRNQFNDMQSTFTNNIGTKLDNGMQIMQSNLNNFDKLIQEKQVIYGNNFSKILNQTHTIVITDLNKVLGNLQAKISDMDNASKEILKDFKLVKSQMEKDTLDNLSDQLSTVFIDSTKQFFKNLKFYMIIGASCLSVLGTAFVMHYIR